MAQPQLWSSPNPNLYTVAATVLTGSCSGAAIDSVSTVHGFIGGFLMIFGSRIGSGCTSGHGLSGMGLLMLKSIVAVPMMFLGGIIVGFAFQAVDPAGYTGFAYSTYPVTLAT